VSGLTRRRPLVPGARPAGGAGDADGGREVFGDYLAFELHDQQYALPVSSLREILKPPPVTEVPGAPAAVLGIISVRGRVTTLLDARRLLRVAESEPSVRTRILLTDDGEEIVGLLVDRVLSVYRFHDDEVEPASVMGGDMPPYVTGIGRSGIGGTPSTDDDESRQDELHPAMGERIVAGAAPEVQGEVYILLDPAALMKE
jgi:purine-binding chemotaxis protein CheW